MVYNLVTNRYRFVCFVHTENAIFHKSARIRSVPQPEVLRVLKIRESGPENSGIGPKFEFPTCNQYCLLTRLVTQVVATYSKPEYLGAHKWLLNDPLCQIYSNSPTTVGKSRPFCQVLD